MTTTFDPTSLIPSYLISDPNEQVQGRVSGSSGTFSGGKYSYKAVQWTGNHSAGRSFEMSFHTGSFEQPRLSRRNRIKQKQTQLVIEETPRIEDITITPSEATDLVLYEPSDNGHLRAIQQEDISGQIPRGNLVVSSATDRNSYQSPRPRSHTRRSEDPRIRRHSVRRRRTHRGDQS